MRVEEKTVNESRTETVHLVRPTYDPLAQSAEHLPFKQGVRSSNLRRVTKKETQLLLCLFFVRRRFELQSQQSCGLLL